MLAERDPIEIFQIWYEEELKSSSVKIPSACCFSTLGSDGYPNSRFVSLKEVKQDKFVVTGPLDSRKGIEVTYNTKVSLTFWWTETERQVRIQGDASAISRAVAAHYFNERNKDDKVVSLTFKQGKEIDSFKKLDTLFADKKKEFENTLIECPEGWGGFFINPKRIELMEFKENRLHKRTLFYNEGDQWNKMLLQP